MMQFHISPNADAAAFRLLKLNPESNIYAIFELTRRRQLRCWRSVSAESVTSFAVMIEGSQPLRPFIPDGWLVATDAAPACALLDARARFQVKGPISIKASLYKEIFGIEPPSKLKDVHYLLRPGQQIESTMRQRSNWIIQRLSSENLGYSCNKSEFLNLTGDPTKISNREYFYGLFIERKLISILEAGVATHYGVAIQQMYTRPDARRQGYASYLLSSISKCINSSQRVVSYLASAENSAANRLVTSLGFQPFEERVLI